MKRSYIITLLLSFCSLFTYAQDSFFDKFSEIEGTTSVYISKSMLSMIPNMQTEGINLNHVIKKLENIIIINCEQPAVIAKLNKELQYISPKNDYEELMRINDAGEKTTIYMKQGKTGKKEYVLLNNGKNELNIIVLIGNLTLQEIQGVINKKKK